MLSIMKQVVSSRARRTAPLGHEEEVALVSLLDTYRTRCLWFLRPDFVPSSREGWLRTLDLIERYGDMTAFKRVGEAKKWLSRPSNAVF